MSLSTYAGLQAAIASELHRSDLTSYIPDWITLAESRINKLLRVRTMETSVSSTMAAGVVAVPTGYVTMKNVYISNVQPYVSLERKSDTWIYDNYPYRASDSVPKFIAREGNNFIFGPYPDSNYVLTMLFYKRLPALSTGVNDVFTAYPGLWFFGALCEAAHYLKGDQRIPMWEKKFQELIEMVQDESDDEFTSGSQPMMAAG